MSTTKEIHRPGNPEAASDALLRRFIGYNMKRVYMQVREDFTESLSHLGLRVGTFSALAVVVGNPGISQTQLSEVLNIERSGVVAVVDELERTGLLERMRVENDRRAYALRVTAAGRRLWQKAERAVQNHEKALFKDLDAKDLRTLQDLLASVAKSAAKNKARRHMTERPNADKDPASGRV